MRKIIRGRTLLLAILTIAVSWGAQAYQNPITLPGAVGDGVADPCVIKWMGKYYLYCTRAAGAAGLQVWESSDLVTWADKGTCSTDPYVATAWAPDVFYYNGIFYLYVSEGGPPLKHKILSATHPLGPFTGVTSNAGVTSIDGQVFMDDDGTLYFSFAATGGIRYRTMSSPTSIDGTEYQLTSCKINISNTWTEGSQIFKKDGQYYMHYSGNDYLTNYRVHSAQGNSVATLSAQPNNPILIKEDGDYRNVGHNYVVLGPDLKTYYTLYHAMDSGSTYRRLMVDKMWFDRDSGDSYAYGPSFTTQENPTGPTWKDDFNRASIGSGWVNELGGSWGVWGNQLMWGNNKGSSAWSRQVCATAASDDYVAEFNTKLMSTGTSGYAKYGVVAGYDGSLNAFTAWIDPTNNLLATWALVDGVDKGWVNSAPLPAGWDHTKWHNLRIEKKGTTFNVYYDNMLKITRQLDIQGGKIGVVLEDCHADFGWCAFSDFSATETEQGDWFDSFTGTTINTNSWINEDGGSWGIWDPDDLMWGDGKGTLNWARQVSTKATDDNYELDVETKLMGMGATSAYPKYGAVASYDTIKGDAFIAWIDPTSRVIATWAMEGWSVKGWANSPALPSGADLYDWHTITIEKIDYDFSVFFDGIYMMTRHVEIDGGSVGAVLEDSHADFGLIDFRSLEKK